MRSSFRKKIRWGIVRTHHTPVLGSLYRKACQLGTYEVGRRLARMPGVDGVFVRHSHPFSPTFIAGHSDLDLTLVFHDQAAEDPQTIRECSETIRRLSRFYFFVWPQDVRFISRGELGRYLTSPASPEILNPPWDWILIAGNAVRGTGGRYLPSDRAPWHPEFNKWWANILQSQLFPPQDGFDKRFMRTFYRSALKSQLHLRAAQRPMAESATGYVEDGVPLEQFIGDPDLPGILTDLKERHFWSRDPDNLRSRILRAILLTVGDFYGGWKIHAETIRETPGRPRSTEEPHRSYCAELQRRIEGHSELTSILEAAVAYPSPHWYPYEYQLDLILRDDVSLEDFMKGVRALRLGFGGRTFAIGTTHAQLTLVVKAIYQHPLYFLGTPFPFLREHIQDCGTLVYGEPIESIKGSLSGADLTEWCRIYLPYHMFNFRRRPEYFSKDCNFYQLASIRLFLETGEILTDVVRIRQAYVDRFAPNDRDRAVLDYYLHRAGTPASFALYADAFSFISRQYHGVESLLLDSRSPSS